MKPDDNKRSKISFAVSVSPDRDGFLRRCCPSCGREFKTGTDAADLQWALSSYCRQVGFELGEGHAKPSGETRLRCPYCQHEDESSNMHTEATVTYLKRMVYRECAIPMLNNAFRGLESLNRSSSGGLISIEFKHNRLVMPVRPIHGPEPPDMKIVTFLCCGEKIKVDEEWTDVRVCPFCGTHVVLI